MPKNVMACSFVFAVSSVSEFAVRLSCDSSLNGEYHPLISTPLFLEIEDVFARERTKELVPLTSKEIRTLVNAFYSTCKWVPIYFLWRPNLSDEGDNFLIELAIAGNASAIVTNNIKDLHGAELVFSELNIMKPEQILREI